MSEMKSCSIAELMGISKHKYFISNNELLWWQARSSMKPLPASREDMFHAEDLYFASKNREVDERRVFEVRWFQKDRTEEWAEQQKLVSARQKKLNEKIKADLDNG